MMILAILLHILRISSTIYVGWYFNYERFDELTDVIEGEVISIQNDDSRADLTVRVTQVWAGSLSTGDILTFSERYGIDLGLGDKGLFLFKGLSYPVNYGLARDGCYLLASRSTPDVLTSDDLDELARGNTPVFNDHESRIAVHFPFSADEIRLYVYPEGMSRRWISTTYSAWNGLEPGGEMSNSGFMSELLIHTGNEHRGINDIELAGEVRSYSDNTFFIDVWPRYPCFPSVQALDDFYQYGTVPVYVFRLDIESNDYWSIGIPDEGYLITQGDGFYLRGRQRYVMEDSVSNFQNRNLYFEAFSVSYSPSYHGRRCMLSMEGLDFSLNRPLLSAMLDAQENGPIAGTLFFLETDDSEPELYCECTVSLYTPEFVITTECDSQLMEKLDGAVLSFDETGVVTLEYGNSTFRQLASHPDMPYLRYQQNNAVFTIMGADSDFFILNIPGVTVQNELDYREYADRTFVAELLDEWLLEGSVECRFYQWNEGDEEPELAGNAHLMRI